MALEPCIGLEVHVELDTESKMFCACRNEFGAEPNSRCCPVCLGLPGSLPVPNRTAVEYVIRTGLALGCQVAERCRFARKNYFYPDLPKNFQISQYEEPLTYGGHIDLEVNGQPKHIRIRRAHLEEDTGKNIHLPDGRSLVDYNRCGIPLMEIVTEPDFTSPEQCRAYLTELRLILRYLEVSTANMEEGVMRAEPTVNLIDRENGEATPKVEIKNLNSIKSAYDAVGYEIQRQRRCLETGEEMFQETRLWDEQTGQTATMRRKESADDYMYFPEPDLVPLAPEREWVESIRASLPELPVATRRKLVERYGLPEYDAEVITVAPDTVVYYEETVAAGADPKAASNWLMGDVMGYLNEHSLEIADLKVAPQMLAELLALVENNTISGKIAKDVFATMAETGQSAQEIVKAEGLQQISDEGELARLVDESIGNNPQAVEDFKSGKQKALGAMVGYIMAQTKGQANPQLVNQLLREKLGQM